VDESSGMLTGNTDWTPWLGWIKGVGTLIFVKLLRWYYVHLNTEQKVLYLLSASLIKIIHSSYSPPCPPVLRIVPRFLHMLGKCATTWATNTPLHPPLTQVLHVLFQSENNLGCDLVLLTF
jgi:hypothetical protein